MTKPLVLVVVLLGAFAPPASACQHILVDHPGIQTSADLIAEAVVSSSERDPRRSRNALDPARVLGLKVTKMLKGTAREWIRVPTAPCYVAGYSVGSPVTVVRFPGGEYHVVARPQR